MRATGAAATIPVRHPLSTPNRSSPPHANPTLDPRRGLCGHGDAHAGHRGRQHRALDIAADLDTGLSGLQWVVDAYTLALAAVVLTAGSLADRLGRRRLFTIGLVDLHRRVARLCGGAGHRDAQLDARRPGRRRGDHVRRLARAARATRIPTSAQRAGALAAYGATIGASFAIGPLVGGALTSGLDWRWIFLVNLPIGLVCIVVTRAYVAESRDPAARGIDWPGQVTLTAGLFLLVLALLRGNEDGWTSATIVAELVGAAALLAAFVAIEARVAEPMLPLRLFRNRSFTGAQVAAFAISASFFAIFLYTTLYLQQILGLSAIEAGLVLPAGHDHDAVRRRRRRARSARRSPAPRHGRRRARARRRRHGPAHARRASTRRGR